jgi:hypothetical protein
MLGRRAGWRRSNDDTAIFSLTAAAICAAASACAASVPELPDRELERLDKQCAALRFALILAALNAWRCAMINAWAVARSAGSESSRIIKTHHQGWNHKSLRTRNRNS